VPSPSGLGIAMVIPGANGIAMFIGGLCAELLRRFWKERAERCVVPVATGLIAGESVLGAFTTLLKVFGTLKM